jgi:hypothetical protein
MGTYDRCVRRPRRPNSPPITDSQPPETSAKLAIAGDKIKRMEPYSGHAGLKAFLSALGIELPSETQ